MNHFAGCIFLGLSALIFSMAHWGKPLQVDMLFQVLAAAFLTIGLALVFP